MADKLSASELVSLGEEIAAQAVHLDAAMHRLLVNLRRFDAAYGWQRQGFDSCAHWLSHRVGWDLSTSRERVRVARALEELPRVDEALAAGQLSYSKARAITRVATPATEPTLLKYAEVCTASQLETVCRKFHAAERIYENPGLGLPREDERYVVATPTASGMVSIKALLRADEAALLMHVLQRAAQDCCSEARESLGSGEGVDTGDTGDTGDAGDAGGGRRDDDYAKSIGRNTTADVSAEDSSEGRSAIWRLSGGDVVGGAVAAGAGASEGGSPGAGASAGAFGGAGASAEAFGGAGASAEASGGADGEMSELAIAALPAASAKPMRVGNRADGLMALVQAYLRGSNAQRSPVELIVTTAASMLHAPGCDRRSPERRETEKDVSPHDPIPATAVADTDLYLSKDATRRLACDCGLVEATVDDHGEPLSIGRKTRTIPAALKRALRLRDRTCRFPGCDHRLYLDGHHLKHWADGGETKLSNLALLCSRHHTYVHEQGYRISRDEQGALTFFDPLGEVVVAVPPRPAPPGLGWSAIHAANANVNLDPTRLAPRGRSGRLDVSDAVERLFKAKGATVSSPSSATGASDASGASGEAEREQAWEEDDAAAIAHAFWEGGQRVTELLEWSLAEVAATGIDPMAQVPQPYCAPPDWREKLAQRMAEQKKDAEAA